MRRSPDAAMAFRKLGEPLEALLPRQDPRNPTVWAGGAENAGLNRPKSAPKFPGAGFPLSSFRLEIAFPARKEARQGRVNTKAVRKVVGRFGVEGRGRTPEIDRPATACKRG